MLERRDSYEALYRDFRWHIPERFNIGTAVADAWALREPERLALLAYRTEGEPATLTYGDLARHSNALASSLRRHGVRRGDRVALLLPQGFAVAIAHTAIYKLGAIAVPLALLFGIEALEYRLHAAGVAAVITNAAGLAKLRGIAGRLPELKAIVSTDGADAGALDFDRLVAEGDADFSPEDTGPDDPALMIFTSGTTGPPKGALHGHRVLLGHLPGVQMPHEFLPQPGDLMWTPADWAWAGGLLNVLLPALHFGVPVVASPSEKFDPEGALGLMEKAGVRNAFIPPTALRMLRSVNGIRNRFKLNLRTVGSGGESLGRETSEWGESELGLTINEFYGQTECNLVLASCAAIKVSRAGAIGLPVPGHEVAVIDEEGRRAAPGETGQIAVRRPDPVMFLEYWNNPEATAKKFIGDWMITGDQGSADKDGYVTFFGRDDDVITSAGYRIGPAEIEDCLTGHPAVALAAAVGKPDALRTEIVKAYVVLRNGVEPGEGLAAEIRDWVRTRLSAHEYPREVEFVDSMPLTTTGKVIRRIFRDRARQEASAPSGQEEKMGRTSGKPATGKKAAAERKTGEVVLLSGGNPQIAKGYGDVPVQAYIAAMPGWKSDVGRRLDAIIEREVPGVRKAVKWNSPFYGMEDDVWFLSYHCFAKYVKVTFFRGTSLEPVPAGTSKHPEVRYLDIHEGELDEARFADWVKQASRLPGEKL